MISIDQISNRFSFKTSRAGGKGGQNVNKVETKVILTWDFENSIELTEKEKECIRAHAKSYLTLAGIKISDDQDRSQLQNKENCIKRLEELLRIWLKPRKKRIPTKVPRSVIRKRLNDKKRKSDIKKNRNKPRLD